MNISITTISIVLLINLLFPIRAFSEEQISALQQINNSIEKTKLSFWGGYSFSLANSANIIDSALIHQGYIGSGLNSTTEIQAGLAGFKFQPTSNLSLEASWIYSNTNNEGVLYKYEYNGLNRGVTSLSLFDNQVRLSGGRRPIGDSVPLNNIQNESEHDDYGNKSLLANFHFDGAAITIKPQELSNWGSSLQLSYGHGYGRNSLGHQSAPYLSSNSTNRTNVIGASITPVSRNDLDSWIRWTRLTGISDDPDNFWKNEFFGGVTSVELGYVDWVTTGLLYKKQHGAGVLNIMVDGGISIGHPNANLSAKYAYVSLLSGQPFAPEEPTSKTGYAAFLGIRYDFPTNTKVGFEYSTGSKYWITPETSLYKLGTRGSTYEPFIMQEIKSNALNSVFKRVLLRVGYQYIDYTYTNSNNWIGGPLKISELSNGSFLFSNPTTHTSYAYSSIEVHF